MPNEDLKAITKLRDILVSNISEMIYDETDTSKNNFSTDSPDELFIKSTIPHFGLFCEMSDEEETNNGANHTYKLEEYPDGSFRVWTAISVTNAIYVLAVLEETPKKLIQVCNKIKAFLSNVNSISLFNTIDDGFNETADIKLFKLTKTYKSGSYPFRKDFRIKVDYFIFNETIEYPADNIQVDLETPSELPAVPSDLPVPVASTTTYTDLPNVTNGTRIEIKKI